MNYRSERFVPATGVVRIALCQPCCRLLWPTLQAPAFDEAVLIEAVARKLEQCETCKPEAPKLRAAARRSGTESFWAFVEDLIDVPEGEPKWQPQKRSTQHRRPSSRRER